MLKFGLPRGSVLGPILYTLHTQPLGDIGWQNTVNCHMYTAGDNEPYNTLKRFEVNQLCHVWKCE